MPTTTIPKSGVQCACGATATRHTYARMGWMRVEGPRLDASGRREVKFTCRACLNDFPADAGVHSCGKSSGAHGAHGKVRAGVAATAGNN